MNPHNAITTRLNSLAGIDKPENRNAPLRIKDYTDNRVVGYWCNRGHDLPITVSDVKNFVPESEWGITMRSAVQEIKELNEYWAQ